VTKRVLAHHCKSGLPWVKSVPRFSGFAKRANRVNANIPAHDAFPSFFPAKVGTCTHTTKISLPYLIHRAIFSNIALISFFFKNYFRITLSSSIVENSF
jgi:hypothetical protein